MALNNYINNRYDTVEYAQIDGYPYEIYEDGRVFRCERIGKTGRCLHRLEVKPHKLMNGYLEVRLFNTKENRYRKLYLHRVLYMAFKGDIGNLEIDHIDGNPGNCALSNLRAVSHKTNCNNEISKARYRISNSLDKGKFDRDKMQAAKSPEAYDKLVNTYKELKEKHGQVGIWMLLRVGHCNYYRGKRIIAMMEQKDGAKR